MGDPSVKKLKALDLGKEATTHHDYKMLEIMLKQGALLQLCRGDCRSSFVINKKNAGALAHKDVHPQFGFALNSWGDTMEHCSELAFKRGIARACRTMPSQLQQAIMASKCKSFDEVNAYCKKYCIQLHKQCGMQPLKQAKPFIDLKIPKRKFNECLSIRSYRKTDHGHSSSFHHPLDALDDEKDQS